jgi:hypothetical protein
MTLTKKIIEFNPAFLGAGGSSKTKKNRAPRVAPLISPNVLRNRLLKRIKEHKKKELSLSGGKVSENLINSSILSNTEERNNNKNEFDDSFTFLEDLAKKKQQTTNILNKSIKHRPLFNTHPPQTNVYLDLPDELNPETTFTVSPSTPSPLFPITTTNFSSRVGDNVPYGILKGGSKPTFRDWNKTRKNLEPITTTIGAGMRENDHTQRLKDLQLKLNAKSLQQPPPQLSEPILFFPPAPVQPPKAPLMVSGGKPQVKSTPLGKKLLKRTIRRKYTLGKSKLKKSVSILLKDRETRKNVLIAHRALKTVPLSDIHVYLKKQNLIKIGSAAPADVVRQIYESALLAGEITNVNKDILLHNFIKGESDTIF